MNRQELLELTQSYENLGTAYHALKTGSIPSRKRIADIDTGQWEDFISYVKNTYEYNAEDHFQDDYLSSNEENTSRIFLHLKSNITLYNPLSDMADLIFDSTSDIKALKDLQNTVRKINAPENGP